MQDGSEVISFRHLRRHYAMRTHNQEICISSVIQGLCLETGNLLLSETSLVLLETVQELIDAADPAITGGPCIEVIGVDTLLSVNCHYKVAITCAGNHSTIFQNVGKTV